MQEAYAELTCPDCDKLWEIDANTAPAPDADHRCPDCGAGYTLAEFTRTSRDLQVVRSL
jgi:predicted RNA-binding Zn-ribbon protein involved in translation (DUF1610 family)